MFPFLYFGNATHSPPFGAKQLFYQVDTLFEAACMLVMLCSFVQLLQKLANVF